MRSAVFLLLAAATASAQSIGTFIPTGSMSEARSQHTATLLNDGRVLITGGVGDSVLSSAELYDPARGMFTPTGSMRNARWGHTATLLEDGRVLVAGGWNDPTAEIYDPATGTFTLTGSLLEVQGGHAAILLPNGKVLIAGGERAVQPVPTAARAELYDPLTGIFSFAENYAEGGTLYPSGGPIWPTMNRLADGRILIIAENPPEIYDPFTGSFSITGAMVESSYAYGVEWHAATTLRDGAVLLTGGSDDISCGGFASAEIYDSSTSKFSVVGPMTQARDIHTSTRLPDGTVLLTGGGEGWCGMPTHDTAELYMPSSRSFVAAGHMTHSRTLHTATLLNDGTVLIAGGSSYWPHATTNTAELYRPASVRTGRMRTRR